MFAFPPAFNLSCRMERLFNSSITRKCPPEQRREQSGGAGDAGLEEAGCIWISPIYQPVISAGGQRKVESQEQLRGKPPCAVNPLIFLWETSRVSGFMEMFALVIFIKY